MKYDCGKTLDFLKEKARMCNTYSNCLGCPYVTPDMGCAYCHNITQEHIDIVQKWSDEHPEIPKLTKKEEWFLDGFCDDRGMTIKRNSQNVLYVCHYTPFGENTIMIDSSMFPFISAGEEWNFQKLFSLEVIEEC